MIVGFWFLLLLLLLILGDVLDMCVGVADSLSSKFRVRKLAGVVVDADVGAGAGVVTPIVD